MRALPAPTATSVLLAATLCALLMPPWVTAQEPELPPPQGWKIRTDRSAPSLGQVQLADMPPGWQIATGPAAILWNPDVVARGAYRVEMEVFLFDPRGRREPFGLFIGGLGLEGEDPSYVAFLVRDGSEFRVERHIGSRVEAVRGWIPDRAVAAWADRGLSESARNVLTVDVDPEAATFRVNGHRVATVPRSQLPALDGIVGIRVGGALSLHVSQLQVMRR